MINELPEEVIRAVRMLSEAEKAQHSDRDMIIEKFKIGIGILKDYLEGQPDNEKVKNIMRSYTKAILFKAIQDLRGYNLQGMSF